LAAERLVAKGFLVGQTALEVHLVLSESDIDKKLQHQSGRRTARRMMVSPHLFQLELHRARKV
jgi:hypothetical protein